MSHPFEILLTYDLSDNPRLHKGRFDADYFDWMFDEVAAHGPATVLFRANLGGRTYYPSRVFSAFDHACCVSPEWRRVADVLDRVDPLAEVVRAARERDLPIMIWTIWNEWHCTRPGVVNLVDPLWYDQPTKYWASRDRYRLTRTECHQAHSCRLYQDWETSVKEGTVDGIAPEMNNTHKPDVEIGDTTQLTAALGDASILYPWSIPVWMDATAPGASIPFSMSKWRTKAPEDCIRQVRMARDAGAAGVIVHEFYWHLFTDTQGKDIGFGPLPQRGLWETLRV